jgi:hypothetical protein
MSHRWGAYITTVDNRLEYVEFDTPSITRDAAIAQVKSMYGAKSVNNCNPVSCSSSDESERYSASRSGSSGGIFALAVLGGGVILAIEVWKIVSTFFVSFWQWIVSIFSFIPFLSPQLLVGGILGFFILILILGALDG